MPARLAGQLLELMDRYGRVTPSGIRIDERFTHMQLAEMIGTSRETLTKVLNELRESGLIDVRERLVWVLDADGLERLKTARASGAAPGWRLHCRAGDSRPKGTQAVTETGTMRVKSGLAEMLKGGVIMDVTNAEQARIAEDAGACAVMALERVPADIRRDGGVARMADPQPRSARSRRRSRSPSWPRPASATSPRRRCSRRSRSTTSTSPRC